MKTFRTFVVVALVVTVLLFPSVAAHASDGSTDLPAILDVLASLLQPVLAVVLPVLVPVLLAYARAYWDSKRQNLSERQYTLLRWFVSAGVWAAEQAMAKGEISREQRERYVLDFVQQMADQYKIPVDVKALYVLIRAAVGEELNKNRIAPVSPTVG